MIKNSDQQRNKFFNITFHNRNIIESQSSQRSQRFRTPVITNPDQRRGHSFVYANHIHYDRYFATIGNLLPDPNALGETRNTGGACCLLCSLVFTIFSMRFTSA